MERPSPTVGDMMPKRDNEKDLELDKKIEALRRKNEALMKRYKEVEEDKKRAEEEGMALLSRKGKADDLTITISKSTTDSRVVVTKLFNTAAPAGKEEPELQTEKDGEGPSQGAGRGHRKQLTVTAGKRGKRVVSERPEKKPVPVEVKSTAEDGQARHVESAGRGKQPTHITTKKNTAAQEDAKQGQKQTREHQKLEECKEPEWPQASTDLNIPTTKEEQEEYVKWKKEREQIDRERVARHKNAKGQWRRAWDMDKSENMFSDKSVPERDWGPSSRGGRGSRRGQNRAIVDPKGLEKRGKDKGGKKVQVMSSKAKGKDRLTGRARRWQENEEGDSLQPDTTLEEFLEELDALPDVETEEQKGQLSPSGDMLSPSDEGSEVTSPCSSREGTSTQKKVRFSEELIVGAHTSGTTGSQDSSSELGTPSLLKKTTVEQESQQLPRGVGQSDDVSRDEGEATSPPTVAQEQECETECTTKDTEHTGAKNPYTVGKASTSTQKDQVQPVEVAKCNISNAEELRDSGLSVLSLEAGEPPSTHCSSSDKAREHGKIV